MTFSLRLDRHLAQQLAALAKARGISRSELVRQCLEEYLAGPVQGATAWELGKDLFGCYKSGRGDLSQRVKEIAKEKIHARAAHKSRR
jgi:hypothetical protein